MFAKLFRALRGPLVLLALSGCALTVKGTTHLAGRPQCPVPVTAVIMDVLLGVGAFGVSAIKWEADKPGESVAYTSLGVATLGGALYSELACLQPKPKAAP